MKLRHLIHRRYPAPRDRVTDNRPQFALRWQDHLNTLRPHHRTHAAADGPRPQDPAGCLLLLGAAFLALNALVLTFYSLFYGS